MGMHEQRRAKGKRGEERRREATILQSLESRHVGDDLGNGLCTATCNRIARNTTSVRISGNRIQTLGISMRGSHGG